jgi:glycosyltransferase involved in cell wall biosynthesis
MSKSINTSPSLTDDSQIQRTDEPAHPQSPIRVLVLSHSYIMKPYRRKFALVGEHPDVDIRVITPKRWYESIQEIAFEPSSQTRCDEFPLPIRFSGYGSRFYYRHGLKTHFRDFQPQIIHLEEEAWSINALQAIRLKRKYCPQSRFIFRTSLSIPAKQRFGLLPVWIERKVFRETDVAFPLSESAGQILRQRGYQGELIPFSNGVDCRLFHKTDASELLASLGLQGHFVIGYVGRLEQMKGVDTLLAAAAMLDLDYRLLIVGDGTYKPELVKIAEQLGIANRMIWVDTVPPEKVPIYINCMNTVVVPSRTTPDWVEFFGRVLIEGMACEVPVIGSDSGEIPNVIGDGGLVFPEDNAESLTDRIQQVAQDALFRVELVKRGLERVQAFTWETIAQQTYEVYRELKL